MKESNEGFDAIRWNGQEEVCTRDLIVKEEPLQVLINGKPYAVTMRTPGHDIAFITGLLFSENIYRGKRNPEVLFHSESQPFQHTVASVWIDPEYLGEGFYSARSTSSISSCGICGIREIEDLVKSAIKDKSEVPGMIQLSTIHSLFDDMYEAQSTFQSTGGSHAAACYGSSGRRLAIHEDIGRHNAVDKVIGELILNDMLGEAVVMCVSGRISFEIVSKCYCAGIPVLAAVSSPSSMAIEFAKKTNMTLLGFCRRGSASCYSHPSRLDPASIESIHIPEKY